MPWRNIWTSTWRSNFQCTPDFKGAEKPLNRNAACWVAKIFDHHLTTTAQLAFKTPEKAVVTTNNGLFLVFSAAVQNQQNSRFIVGLYRLVVVLRLNTYFQLHRFISCIVKIGVLSSVSVTYCSKFLSLLNVVFSYCWTATLERCSTQLNLFSIHFAPTLNFA